MKQIESETCDVKPSLHREHPGLWGLSLGIAALAVAVRLWMARSTHATGEDALIILRYAEHIAAGHGFVYNIGERVLGSTTPLYTLLLALAAWLHADAETVGKGCNILAEGITCLFIVRLSARRGLGAQIAGLFAALLYALSSTPISISISGMETGLVTCAGIAAIVAFVEGRSRALYLSAALLFLLRIDTLALSGLLIGAHLWRVRRIDWSGVGLALFMVLPWIVFATLYFGSPIPTSLIAKLTVYRGVTGASHASILAAFADQFIAGWFQRIVTLLFVLGAARVCLQAIERRQGDISAPPAQATLAAPLLWLLIYYSVMLMSHVPAFAWYFLPPWPLLLTISAMGGQSILETVGRRLPHRASLPLLPRIWPAALALFGLFGLLHLRSVRAEIAQAQRLEDEVRRPLGLWLRAHAEPKERILLEPIGVIGYYSQRPILDMIGLVSPEVFPSYRTSTPLADIVQRFHPEWLCLRPREAALLSKQNPLLLPTRYALIREFHAPDRPPSFLLYHFKQENSPRVTQ